MPSPAILQSFVHFPKLPFELQDMIWSITLSEPRSISGEDCFREWWYGKIVRFLLPVALHVCHRSRSLGKSTLKCTTVKIPGVPGSRIIYLNQAHDYFTVTNRDMQTNRNISSIIENPILINRVVISGISKEVLLKNLLKNMGDYFNHLPGLNEVVLTDRARYYMIYQQTFSRSSGRRASVDRSALVRHVQQFFGDGKRNVSVSGCWFDGEYPIGQQDKNTTL